MKTLLPSLRRAQVDLQARAEDAGRETFLAREQRGRAEAEVGRVRAQLADLERQANEAQAARKKAEERS